MQPDDIAALESLLRQIVQSQAPAIRHTERALEILTARRHRRNGAGTHDGLLATLIDESRFTVHWNGATCDLGATVLFRLFRRLVPFEPQPVSNDPLPGSVLVRQYKGREIQVRVPEEGFEYDGQPYRSLSAVAKAITGSHWNGRAFFQLKKGGA